MKKLVTFFALTLATHELGGRYLSAHDPIPRVLDGDALAALLVLVVIAARIALFVVAPAWVIDLAIRRAWR
jgi:hypothetical protein